MPISNANRRCAVTSESTDKYKVMKILRQESRFAWMDGIVSFLHPTLSFGTLKSPSLSKLHCEGKPKQWSSSWQVILLQTSTHLSSRNWTRCKRVHFFTKGPWWSYAFLQGWPQSISVHSGIVVVGISDPACRSIWPSATHWFINAGMADECPQGPRAISRNDNLHSR